MGWGVLMMDGAARVREAHELSHELVEGKGVLMMEKRLRIGGKETYYSPQEDAASTETPKELRAAMVSLSLSLFLSLSLSLSLCLCVLHTYMYMCVYVYIYAFRYI
jgi:hypothetical protein